MVKSSPPYSTLAHIPEGFYTRGQVAQQIGKSKDTIRRWHESGRFVTQHSIVKGKTRIWLYSATDVASLKELARTVRPGRKTNVD